MSAPQVRQVTLVLEPCAGGADLVRRALSANAKQASEVLELERGAGGGELLGGEVRGEGSEKLKAGGRRRDGKHGRRDGLGQGGGQVGRVA